MILMIVLGVLLATLGEYVALAMTGAGEGWISPTLYSTAMFITYPYALVILRYPRDKAAIWDWMALGLAAILDIFLAMVTVSSELGPFMVLGAVAWFWLLLWS